MKCRTGARRRDLLTGLTVDVTDTIPGDIFDELFAPERPVESLTRRR
jgi:hypothetical protein